MITGATSGDSADDRRDPVLGTRVHVVGSRQTRPNRATPSGAADAGCPFCPGGLEAPEPYETRWIRNRWPAMPDERCEVVLYTPEHEATLWSLGPSGVRRVVDLWAERSAALGARDDVDFVLVFENRGTAVGATIDHPHGQIYAYDHVPDRPSRLFANGWTPEPDPVRAVVTTAGWTAYVPYASTFPVALTVAPLERTADLAGLSDAGRDGLATILTDVLERLDRLYGQPLPYMMWLMQAPCITNAAAGTTAYPDPWMQIEIVSPWRAPGVARFIAAAEVSCEEYFNPVVPEDLAARLRALASG